MKIKTKNAESIEQMIGKKTPLLKGSCIMAFEQRDNAGTLFVNDRKKSENHPDRTGKAMIGGVMYYVNGWIKDGGKGKFLSLSFKPIEESGEEDQTRQPTKNTRPAPTQHQPEEELPF